MNDKPTMNLILLLFLSVFNFTACKKLPKNQIEDHHTIKSDTSNIIMGAEQFEEYKELLTNKRVALVVNQTSVIDSVHIVNYLLNKGIQIQKVFSPEHGFRGTADAGEHVESGIDKETGLPIVSLYGENYNPTQEVLADVDVVIFDIQDVGARFYTYIATMQRVMEACAKYNKEFIVFDRPNPNGHYVDGPILEDDLHSGVGLQPIPIVHGMTVGEYANYLIGERLLRTDKPLEITVIPCKNYTHTTPYELPIAPSPNLPNQQSIILYPSLCLFEGTNISIGRGTTNQFQVIGSPKLTQHTFHFTPVSRFGAKKPKFENKTCYGYDLTEISMNEFYRGEAKLNLSYIIDIYNFYKDNGYDFYIKSNFFDKLVGTYEFREQLEAGLTEDEIRATWVDGLNAFKRIRKNYLLYPDFE